MFQTFTPKIDCLYGGNVAPITLHCYKVFEFELYSASHNIFKFHLFVISLATYTGADALAFCITRSSAATVLNISMAYCKRDVTSLPAQWSYISFQLSNWYRINKFVLEWFQLPEPSCWEEAIENATIFLGFLKPIQQVM